MRIEDLESPDQPRSTKQSPAEFIQYRSQQEAFAFLREVLASEQGIGLLHGPELSGKSTLAHHFIRELPRDLAVAVVDGSRLKTTDFLSTLLAQFGYDVVLESTDELLSMLSVFLVQQARVHQPPVLILENLHGMYPSALCALCKLAELTIHGRYTLRIILISNRPIQQMLASPGLRIISQRLLGDFELGPLTAKETLVYLYTKAEARGVTRPDSLFSVDTCDKLHFASGGLPGELDNIAMSAIVRAADSSTQPESIDSRTIHQALRGLAKTVPADWEVIQELPKLLVTCNGETLQEIELDGDKSLVGRSSLSDILIKDQFISKHHAMFIRANGALHLVDLNSRNGTFVNSKRVTTSVLRHDDIIALGNHRIKVIDSSSRGRTDLDAFNIADTAAMKNIADMRHEYDREDQQHTVLMAVGSKQD